ncbi:hypothetical protein GUJ93_ZPchr0004g39686 [Zizania palustris]|uniref:DUF7358 domain-containing protein n=1 Tax=Zizania palustris TaxID=103762 RepID=A0A8J5SKP4_ZIZPA|nr:hypothetical protein GUJ93_ZPchr0004g39686 [Zizania palustris]
MLGAALTQQAAADAIARRHLDEDASSVADDAVGCHEIRVRTRAAYRHKASRLTPYLFNNYGFYQVLTYPITISILLNRWRSFYATDDMAWKAHYREVFDHGIREALCCLGRAKYLTVLEEDELYSVARLLGDLVAYRASGTGHLELLAGQFYVSLPKFFGIFEF